MIPMLQEDIRKVGCRLVNVGPLRLSNTDRVPYYNGVVVSGDMIIVIDRNACKLRVHRFQDGSLLVTHQLESWPTAICLINDTELCVIMYNGVIQIMSIDITDMTRIITTTRILSVRGVLDGYHGVVTFKENLVVCGVKHNSMCWCIVSLDDGHVDAVHQICKGYIWNYLAKKDNTIYISCYACRDSPDNGLYGYDILNPRQRKYRYKHKYLDFPTAITTIAHGFIFLCNNGYPARIHHLTDKCQILSIFTQEIPWSLDAIFWDERKGHLFVTCKWCNTITVCIPEYPKKPVLWNFTTTDVLAAWQSIENYLLEELAPTTLLHFFENQTLLSAKDCKDMYKLESRRKVVRKLLQRIKAKLPGAFSSFLRALDEAKQDAIVHGLRQHIERTHDYETNAMVPSIAYYTVKLEMLKGGAVLHETESKARAYFDKGSIVFDCDMISQCVKWETGSVLIYIRPLSKTSKETLSFFCQNGGMKDFVLDLLKKKDVFSSLPEGEMAIHVQVHSYDQDLGSEGAEGLYRDYTQMIHQHSLSLHDNFTVRDDPEVIEENLRIQFCHMVDEIEPLHIKGTFETRGVLDNNFFNELKMLKGRRERAAHFLKKVLEKGKTALATLVYALRNEGLDYLANRLCIIPETSSQFRDKGQVDDSLIEVVQVESSIHALESMLWSCHMVVEVRKNEDGGHISAEAFGNDERKLPVTVQTSTKTGQSLLQRESSGSEEDQEDDAPITQEHINHARLYNVLATVCADSLRDILVNQVPVPYASIYQAILANEANLARKMSNEQNDLVFPDTPGVTGTVDQFDISLLYTLIRNVSTVPAPLTGWGNPPMDQPRDTCLGASVERIRFFRNNVSGHSVDGKISDTEFKDYWQMIDDVIRDIESVIGVRGCRIQLEKRKNQAITPHEARRLQSKFQEYKKQVEDAKEKLQIAMEAVQKL